MKTARQSLLRIFAAPLLIALATIAGLVLGLTGNGGRDVAAWTLTGIAPLMILAALWRARTTANSTTTIRKDNP